MMRSCWLLRNYVNECVPALTNTETRRRGKETHTALCRHSPNSSHEKEEKRGRKRFKICCRERNKWYSSTQKQEQSFIFAFWNRKCNCCFKSVQMWNKTCRLKNENWLAWFFPVMKKIKGRVSILEINRLLENKEPSNVFFLSSAYVPSMQIVWARPHRRTGVCCASQTGCFFSVSSVPCQYCFH